MDGALEVCEGRLDGARAGGVGLGSFPHRPARYPLNLLRRKELSYADADAGFPVSMMLFMLC